MDDITIEKRWSPEVRSVAARLNTDLGALDRAMRERVKRGWDEDSVLQLRSAEEALAIARMMRRLGYGPGRSPSPAVDMIELEMDVLERKRDAALSFMRALGAVRRGRALRTALSSEGRRRSAERVESLREGREETLGEARRMFREDGSWLSPDYAPWVRRGEGRSPGAPGPDIGFKGMSKLPLVEKLLEELVEELREQR